MVLRLCLWSVQAACGFLQLTLLSPLWPSFIIVGIVVATTDFAALGWKRQLVNYQRVSGDADKQFLDNLICGTVETKARSKEWFGGNLQTINFEIVCNKLNCLEVCGRGSKFPAHTHACVAERFPDTVTVLRAWVSSRGGGRSGRFLSEPLSQYRNGKPRYMPPWGQASQRSHQCAHAQLVMVDELVEKHGRRTKQSHSV